MAQANICSPVIPAYLGDLSHLRISVPAEYVLLVTFNRPKSLNAFTPQMLADMRALLNWFEDEPEMWWVSSARDCSRSG